MTLDPIVSARELLNRRDITWVDCRVDEAKYREGHIAGAQHAQLERDLSAPAPNPAQGGRHPLPELAKFATLLGRWGISPRSHIAAYDDQNGMNAAARFWWLLKAVGHEHVQVVDGGLPALIAAGFTLTTDPPTANSEAAPYPVVELTRPTADIDEVDSARRDSTRAVIDVRAAFRYRGEKEPIDPIAGHIPGAKNIELTQNLNQDGTWKSPAQLRAMYTAALSGIAPEQTIVHCGSGVTACHTLLALDRAGLTGAKLYVGSWSEWCRNPSRPREPQA
ncbi:MAG TPA: sulfurtransferase [Polyangiales bacterium]|nr:sulfurtransferase [Polyangiales bacterium]